MTPYHTVFEWDSDKETANLRKHGMGFDMAAEVLGDPNYDLYHVEAYQFERGEERVLTVASHPRQRGRVFVTVWMERHLESIKVTRIISCRKATPSERREYEKAIAEKIG